MRGFYLKRGGLTFLLTFDNLSEGGRTPRGEGLSPHMATTSFPSEALMTLQANAAISTCDVERIRGTLRVYGSLYAKILPIILVFKRSSTEVDMANHPPHLLFSVMVEPQSAF